MSAPATYAFDHRAYAQPYDMSQVPGFKGGGFLDGVSDFLGNNGGLLSALIPLGLTILAPGIGTAIGGAISGGLGLGLGAAGTAALGNGLVGAGVGALLNGGKGALVGGLTGGVGGYLTAGNGLSGIGSALGLSGLANAGAGAAATTAGTGAAAVPTPDFKVGTGGLTDSDFASASGASSGVGGALGGIAKMLPLVGALGLIASRANNNGQAAQVGAPPPPGWAASQQASLASNGTHLSQIPFTYSREQTNPNVDYLHYGQGPSQSFFSDNHLADGGMPRGGALSMARPPLSRHFVDGPGTGRSDSIPAKLSRGEYVLDSGTVSMLGDGSSDAGADRLDKFRENIRKHKGGALSMGRIPPDAKTPEKYLPGGRP